MSSRLDVRELRSGVLGPWTLNTGDGEIIVLSGVSGSGKTRFLRAIADLDPSSGDVRLNGVSRDTIRPSNWRAVVAYLSTDSRWWRDTAREHFEAPNWPGPGCLDLPQDAMDRPLAQLSTGERQRLALLRTLSRQPQVLLLDEPAANLDPESTLLVDRLLLDYRDRHGAAILWVSHDPTQTVKLNARHLEMRGGTLRVPPA